MTAWRVAARPARQGAAIDEVDFDDRSSARRHPDVQPALTLASSPRRRPPAPRDRAGRRRHPTGDPHQRRSSADGAARHRAGGADDPVPYVVDQGGDVLRLAADGTLDAVARPRRHHQRRRRAGLLGLAFSADGDLAYVDYTDHDGNTNVAESRSLADGTFDARPDARAARDRPALPQPQRRRPRVRPRRHALHRHGRRRRPAATPNGGRSDLDHAARQAPAHRSDAVRRPGLHDPRRQPVRRQPTAPAARSGRSGCATRGGSRSTRRPATCGSPTSARTPSRRSTSAAATGGLDAGKGVNFGWSAFEGNDRVQRRPVRPRATTPRLHLPARPRGCSISGGVRARGPVPAALDGWYVFGDYCTRRGGRPDRSRRPSGDAHRPSEGPASVRRPDGESYVLEHGASRTAPDGTIHVLDGSGRCNTLTDAP